MRLALPTLTIALFALAGCVNLAPPYQRPAPVTPDIWPLINGRPGANDPSVPPVAKLGWREFFINPQLRDVVELALVHNQNLHIAALDIEQAREQYRSAGAALFPTISASGSADISKSGDSSNVVNFGGARTGNTTGTTTDNANGSGAHTGGNKNNDTGSAGSGLSFSSGSGVSKSESVELGFASYELDFFGQLRNEKQQALEALRSSAAARRSTQISLIAEAANDWLTLAADKELLALARRTLKSQRANYRLVRARHRYGIATGEDVANAKSTIETARVNVASDTAQIARDRDALNLVVGATIPADDLPGAHVPDQPVLSELPAGVPSSVLQSRPDVRTAEYTLRGDYANIGAARAAFFPRISLTASTGFATRGLTGLFKGSSRTWSFSPQIDLPIFDAGANRAALNIAKIQRKIDVANYEQTIQTAFSEVADALATRATIHEQVAAQNALVAANRRAYRLSLASFKTGIASYIDTLVNQQSLYTAQRTDVSKRLAQQTNLVTLYKVLGGGVIAGPAGQRAPDASAQPISQR